MRPVHNSSGLNLLCSHAVAAVLDVAGPAALLLRSFAIGTTQLPWHTANLQQQHALTLRCYSTPQQPMPRQHEPFQQPSGYAIQGYADPRRTSRDGTSRSRVSSQQQKRHGSNPKVYKQRHSMDDSVASRWPTYKPKTAGSASLRSAKTPGAVARPSKSPAGAASTHHPQHRKQQQQQQQHLPDLPKVLGPHLSDTTAVTDPSSTAAISEGHLMSLIRNARSLGDMEKILILHHASFRANHVAAAVTTLPHLQPESPYNKAARMRRLTGVLGSAVLGVAHQMDAYQVVGCLRALTTPVCAVPLQAAALDRLIAVLLADDARKLWKLHSDDLADLAAAAAAIQLALKQQQQQQGCGLGHSRDRQVTDQDSYGSSSSKKQQQQLLLLLESPDRGSDALAVPDQLVRISSSSSSSSSSGALALQSPLQRLWPLLRQVAKPQLNNFSAGSLALLLHSCAAADQANAELLLLTVSAALAKSHKFDDPVTLTRMLQALALCSSSSSSRQIKSQPVQQLLHALCSILAQNKAQFSSMQLISCITALADLDHYSEAVCLAACKLACRSLSHWDLHQISDLIQGLVRFRYRDDMLLKATVKYLDPDRGVQISAAAAADVLVGMLQLGYMGNGVEEFASAVLRGLTADVAPTKLTPSAAVKLLWATAVLHDSKSSSSSTALQQLLIRRLTDYANAGQQQQQQLSEADLRLLYQAHRLLTDQWLQQQQQQQHAGSSDWSDQGQDDYDLQVEDDQPPLVAYVIIGDDGTDNDSSSSRVHGDNLQHDYGPDILNHIESAAAAAVQQAGGGYTLLDLDSSSAAEDLWPKTLIAAAQRAAAAQTRRSTQQSRKLQQHVQDLFDQIGLDPPVQGFRVDRGALQPDLAFVAQGKGLDLKVALMCDHDVRYTCNAPFELLGYDTVEGWLLKKAGWKVVRLPPHEWELILQDERVHEGSALAYLYNTLAAQGIPL